MFFDNSELKEEIEQKDRLIEKLKVETRKLKLSHKEEVDKIWKCLSDTQSELKELQTKHQDYIYRVEAIVNFDLESRVYNKRYFYDVVENMISLFKRDNRSLSIAVVYIDRYEIICSNTTRASQIIQVFVHKISDMIRESDVFVRFDDGKFVILFPETALDHAKIVAEKLRSKIEEAQMMDDLRFTLSIGLAEFLEQENVNHVLERADALLGKDAQRKENIVCY